MKYLSDGLSLVAVDAETRRVVGMKISHVVERYAWGCSIVGFLHCLNFCLAFILCESASVILLHTREHAPKTRRSLDELLSVYPETHAHLVYVLEKFTWPADIFDKHPSVNRLFDMHGLATIKSHRGRGIATQLMKKSLEVPSHPNWAHFSVHNVSVLVLYIRTNIIQVARKANCDAASEVCSNPHSKRIFDRLGFEVWAAQNSTLINRNRADGDF